MKIDWKTLSEIVMWIMVFFFFYFMGMVSGMLIQQRIIEYGLMNVLGSSNVDIDVNFNETKFVESFNETIMPQLREINCSEGG